MTDFGIDGHFCCAAGADRWPAPCLYHPSAAPGEAQPPGGPPEQPTPPPAASDGTDIARDTAGGGVLKLHDTPTTSDRCATCGRLEPIGLTYSEAPDPPKLDTTICATCLSEALAVFYGRQHVLDGGQIADLATRARGLADASPVDRAATAPAPVRGRRGAAS